MRWFLGLDDATVVGIHGMLVVSVLVLCGLVFLCLGCVRVFSCLRDCGAGFGFFPFVFYGGCG